MFGSLVIGADFKRCPCLSTGHFKTVHPLTLVRHALHFCVTIENKLTLKGGRREKEREIEEGGGGREERERDSNHAVNIIFRDVYKRTLLPSFVLHGFHTWTTSERH